MSDVTRLLGAVQAGDRQAAADLLPLVYDELRTLAAARMSSESPGHTLDATALVHEAYLHLIGDQQFEGSGHFFAAAAEAMRRILVDHARARKRLKRGGYRRRLDLNALSNLTAATDDDLLALDDALPRLATDYLGRLPGDGSHRTWGRVYRPDSIGCNEMTADVSSSAGRVSCIWSVAFSPDGKCLASAAGKRGKGLRGDLRVWDLVAGKEMLQHQNHDLAVLGVGFSEDGQWFGTTGGDGKVRIRKVDAKRFFLSTHANCDVGFP